MECEHCIEILKLLLYVQKLLCIYTVMINKTKLTIFQLRCNAPLQDIILQKVFIIETRNKRIVSPSKMYNLGTYIEVNST